MQIHEGLSLTAALVLSAFSALAAIDGIYLHLVRYRLHARPETRGEHALHTARAVLFGPIVLVLFALPSGGALLWLGVGLAAADTLVELWDVFVEPDSRRALGGLSRGEYLLHVVLTILRTGALALALAARPAEAWRWDAPSMLSGLSPLGATIAANLVPGAAVIAIVHVWLAVRGAQWARA